MVESGYSPSREVYKLFLVEVAGNWHRVRLVEMPGSEDHPDCGSDGAKLRAYWVGQ